MISSQISEYGTRTQSSEREQSSGALQQEHQSLIGKYRTYFEITFSTLKVAGAEETQSLKTWVEHTKATPEDVAALKEFWDKRVVEMLRSGRELRRQFEEKLKEATPYISRASHKRWMDRFENRSIGFKEREYWFKHQLPRYMEGWKTVTEERKTFLSHPSFDELVQMNPRFAVIRDAETFFDLHFDERKGLLAEARATLKASQKLGLDLFAEAKNKLSSAALDRVLAPGKAGVFLERIFEARKSVKQAEAFVRGSGEKSLDWLVRNWREVKRRFDECRRKTHERGEDTAARGLTIVTEGQFLNMAYPERLMYVKELEYRLDDAANIAGENENIVTIRHLIDVKDWKGAAMEIMEAKQDEHVSGRDRGRLDSMERLVKQSGSSGEHAGSMDRVMHAKERIDQVVDDLSRTHSEIDPLVRRLLRGPHGNRAIHQFRWVAYNNRWCRTHGYLDDAIARRGASKENQELTKVRALQGEDVGRHDVLGHDTASQQFIRKDKFAKAKATYRHVNVKDGFALSQQAEWLEREQNPKVLYWTTFCAHTDGDPKNENWHDDLFFHLTELRALSRTIHNAGFMYDGPGQPLKRKN